MVEYLKSIDWATVNWSLVISIIALASSIFFSILSYQMSRRNQILALEKYKQEQEEKGKRKLKIAVSHSSKYDYPLRWLGIWLIVGNQGYEQPILGDVDVTLTFRSKKSEARGCLFSMILFLFGFTDDVEFTFGLYNGAGSAGGVEDLRYSSRVTMNFYLINWDTKKPIYFAPQNEYRMPTPGEKETWYLFGNLPEDETRRWMEQGYQLKKVVLNFITDQGEFEISERITASLVDEKLLQERTSYTFNFEPSHMSSFRQRFK